MIQEKSTVSVVNVSELITLNLLGSAVITFIIILIIILRNLEALFI